MRIHRLVPSAILLAALSATLIAPPSALAGEPAAGTVRVEGFEGHTILPQTEVHTTTKPVPIEGGTCPGTSVGGALYDAVNGNWKVVETGGPFGAELLGIEGVDLPRFGEGNYAFWEIWLNDKPASAGACGVEMAPGEDVVIAGQCFENGPYCPGNPSAPEHFLTTTHPTASVVGVGEPVSVTIGSLNTSNGQPEALPAGVIVGEGSTARTPGPGGVTTFAFSTPGTYTLQAHAPDAVPSDPETVCVHNGNDGTCGTTGPSGASGTTPGGETKGFHGQTTPYTGPYALVAHSTSPLDGHHYRRGHGPRLLSGSVLAHGVVNEVSLELRRSDGGRCWSFDGQRARFVRARCGSGGSFEVSSSDTYSYLLPAALPPGRYVLDVSASDAEGNHTTLARGSSRIVFHVG